MLPFDENGNFQQHPILTKKVIAMLLVKNRFQ